MSLPGAKRRGLHIPFPSMLALSLLGLFVVAAVEGQGNPTAMSLAGRFLPPAGIAGSQAGHLLGTDELGRDVLARVLAAGRPSLLIAALSVLLGAAAGKVLGLAAAYGGATVAAAVNRLAAASLGFPVVLFAVLLAAGGGLRTAWLVLLFALVVWPRFAHLLADTIRTANGRDYVMLARLGGSSALRTMRVHVLPDLVRPLAGLLLRQMAFVVLVLSGLDFLGGGLPAITWGGMIFAGRDYVADAWWLVVAPGLAVTLVVAAFNQLARWLEGPAQD
jgi:peptide/nickel transport system permease protein